MSVTQEFQAMGAGNGFPFCLPRVDVSDYGWWVTLGGFKKTDSGSPTPEQVSDSFTNAKKLFWDLYAVNGLAHGAQIDGGSAVSDDLSVTRMESSNESRWDGPESPDFATAYRAFYGRYGGLVSGNPIGETYRRVCATDANGGKIFTNTDEGAWFMSEMVDLDFGGFDHPIQIGSEMAICRMYDGSINDESNFVGCGVNGFIFAGQLSNNTKNCSVVWVTSFEGEYTVPPSGDAGYWSRFFFAGGSQDIQYVEFDYTTVSGIDFVGCAGGPMAPDPGDPYPTVIDPVNLVSQHGDYSTADMLWGRAELTSLEFYTY